MTELLHTDSKEVPATFPLDSSIYLEQLVILKPLIMKNDTSRSSNCTSVAGSSSSVSFTKPLSETVLVKPGTMLEKLQNASPYNIFFTKIPKASNTLTHPISVEFTGINIISFIVLILQFKKIDLLCPSLGQLKTSLQINFMIDIMWLMEQYKARNLQ